MSEPNNITPQSPPTPAPQAVPPLRKPWAVGARERRLLGLSLALGFVGVSFLLDWMDGPWWVVPPGLGVTVLTAAWYAALFLYRGTSGMEKRVNQVLMGAVALLALTFTIFSNPWFRSWNCGALALLVSVHTWELCGGARLPWYKAGMLFERLWLLVKGPFVRCGALLDTMGSAKSDRGAKRSLPIAIGMVVTVPVLWVVFRVLIDADAMFALVVGDALSRSEAQVGELLLRSFLAVCVMPFVFSLLYFAAHTEQKELPKVTVRHLDSLPAVMLLGSLDMLYLFFLAVQSAALFGGREYLAQAGISFAEYARSGFFQLVGLAGTNTAFILAAVWLCRDDRLLRLFSTALVALTAVLLVSAGWRMTLYVSAYGLSFKRLLTYWGMGMLAILLFLTVCKVWNRDLPFFRVAAPIALAGWLVLNYINVDVIAARYNYARFAAGQLPWSAVDDLQHYGKGRRSYDGLKSGYTKEYPAVYLQLWDCAAEDCRNWTTWSVSAWRASKG